ncbi:MAG: family transporter [Acidimicrobiia bacterium]|nr:family transporter [Acidimicrobiia bacterium]
MTAASQQRAPIPWRTIWASVFAVVVTVLGLLLVRELQRVITWVVVAVFFAVVLARPVAWVERRLHLRRVIAVLLVFVIGLAFLAGAGYVLIRPLIPAVRDFSDKFPQYVQDAQEGRGAVGDLARRLNLDNWIRDNKDKISSTLANGGPQALSAARQVGNAAVAMLTITVLTILLLMEGPEMMRNGLEALPEHRRRRFEAVATDSARAVTGYVAGNLLISVIAALVTFVTLAVMRVPFAGPLALWVGIADLIPLVGATLGAIPAIFVAFLHSVPAGIVTAVVYVVYQQFENHVLQVQIMAKTVAIRPFVVLVSVLVGVELFGFLGALLAIPAAGIIQVVVRDIWDHRQGGLKPVPTVGADEHPVGEGTSETSDGNVEK